VAERSKPTELDGALLVDEDEEALPAAKAYEGSPEEDGKAELALEMLVEILARMELKANVEIRSDAEEIVLDISGDEAGRVIGKKGQTLDALQFLINKIVNRFPEGRRHVVLDSGDYRERRESVLVSMARREAKRAVAQGRVIALDPMSPRDRRLVHLSLAKFPGVSTSSDGEGSERRVRIIPARVRGGAQPRTPRPPRDE
jgi:spoIIIJ-associated protein